MPKGSSVEKSQVKFSYTIRRAQSVSVVSRSCLHVLKCVVIFNRVINNGTLDTNLHYEPRLEEEKPNLKVSKTSKSPKVIKCFYESYVNSKVIYDTNSYI